MEHFAVAFRVVPEESLRMKEGRLDRAAIKSAIAEEIKSLGQMHAVLPDFVRWLVNRFSAGRITADLELEYTAGC